MTGFSNFFSTYTPCSGRDKIRTADGSLSPIAGKGSVTLTTGLTLHSVLHVPLLECNLLSVGQLTCRSNWDVLFSLDLCVFQDRQSGKTIGTAKQVDGLYFF